jgi:hypothetical protein
MTFVVRFMENFTLRRKFMIQGTLMVILSTDSTFTTMLTSIVWLVLLDIGLRLTFLAGQYYLPAELAEKRYVSPFTISLVSWLGTVYAGLTG